MMLCLSSRLPETLECLAKKLESVYKASGGKKINIISHSMGGLLVKCFMSLHSDVNFPHRLLDQCSVLIFLVFIWMIKLLSDASLVFLWWKNSNFIPIFWQIFEKYVKNWIAIAAPFRGKWFYYMCVIETSWPLYLPWPASSSAM